MVGSRTSRRAHLAGCGWFWAWALIGAVTALLSISSLGPILVAPVLLVAYLMASRPGILRSGFGFLSGAGVLLLYVAWVQRDGPGTTCWHTQTASGCEQHLNPLPWLLAGIVLFVGGIAAHARRG
jgi:hypothetical protein